MPTKQILIGGFALHGEDRAGQWVVEELEGWHEPPSPKGSTSERMNGHGEIDAPDYYSARTPTVSGILFHKGRGHALSAMERLSAHMTLEAKKLVVTDAGLSLWANAKLAGLDWTEVTRGAMRFQARFKCVDPFKYGKWRSFESSAGSTGLFHYGNAESYPIVDVTGSASGGYTLEKSGWKVTVTRPLLSGETHSLDFRTGILRVDGAVARGALSFANFKPVRPGFTQNLTITVPSGSASFTAGLYDTYI